MAQRATTELKEVRKQAEKTADTAEAQADQAGSAIADELALLKMQIEDLSETLSGKARATADAAAETASEAARRIAQRSEAGYEQAAAHAADAYAEAERFASERPVLALGLAAGAGVLAGLLLARR